MSLKVVIFCLSAVVVPVVLSPYVTTHVVPRIVSMTGEPGESGTRQVTAVYPSAVRTGQWVTFLASDGTRREAFVSCDRRLNAGDSIIVDSPLWRKYIESYRGRCPDKLLP